MTPLKGEAETVLKYTVRTEMMYWSQVKHEMVDVGGEASGVGMDTVHDTHSLTLTLTLTL